MAIVDIKVPQMGEGLTEVRLLGFMKTPGDAVARDEIIYTMETDKATLEVESAHAGTLMEWLVAEGDVVPIGAAVARIDEGVAATENTSVSGTTVPSAGSVRSMGPQRVIPPRTRSYAKELGISEEVLATIPSVTAKLMPSDLDTFRASLPGADVVSADPDAEPELSYQDRPLPDRQRKLNFHMRRSAQVVVPGTISRPIEWARMREHVAWRRKTAPAIRATDFQAFACCAVRAAVKCPKLRSALIREDTVRQYDRLQLGVAVALPDGELTTAVVRDADLLEYDEFCTSLHERIQSARSGAEHADASVQLLLTYLGAHAVRDAVPVLVAPAAAVIFLGEPYEQGSNLLSNVAMTFDHRLLNGVEAAEMLAAVASAVQSLDVGAGSP